MTADNTDGHGSETDRNLNRERHEICERLTGAEGYGRKISGRKMGRETGKLKTGIFKNGEAQMNTDLTEGNCHEKAQKDRNRNLNRERHEIYERGKRLKG